MDGHRTPLGSRTQATLSWPWLAENGGLVSGGGTAAERAGSGAWGSPISNLGVGWGVGWSSQGIRPGWAALNDAKLGRFCGENPVGFLPPLLFPPSSAPPHNS